MTMKPKEQPKPPAKPDDPKGEKPRPPRYGDQRYGEAQYD